MRTLPEVGGSRLYTLDMAIEFNQQYGDVTDACTQECAFPYDCLCGKVH